ncbi:MAG: methanogenesis marker 3 protein [Methanoregulaceae archaeon]|nr:methanogenesis marker 3 protein [Methanoregulaceae archaeon]
MITIQVDGERRECPDGSIIADILPDRDPACAVAVIRPVTRESAQSESIQLSTTAGEITVELVKSPTPVTIDDRLIQTASLHWADRYAAAFGPFSSTVIPSRTPHLYERGDVILGCGGYDPKRSYLVFSKMRHSADHGAGVDGGVIGRVVTGRGVIDRWTTGDRVTRVQPVISFADTNRSFTSEDFHLVLEDGMQIVSHLRVAALGYGPGGVDTQASGSVEHFLMAMERGHFVVGRAGTTHIRDERLADTEVAAEVRLPRREGLVTVRTRGRSKGSIYVYTADIPGSPSHTAVGQVEHGIELARLAREGQTLCIRTTPERFDLIGRPLHEAIDYGGIRGIHVEHEEGKGEQVVVRQDPGTTLEVLAGKFVHVFSVPLERVIDISLDDARAPESCAVFRKLTGLSTHSVGVLPLFFHFEDVYLFKPEIPKAVRIIPENVPKDVSPANALAITNDSRQGVGMVGIRGGENREFGPTSEPFEGTNLLGTVLETGKLTHIRERENVYIREVRR